MTAAGIDLSGMVVEVAHRFAAPPEQVWALLADLPAMARFSDEVVALEWQPPATSPAQVGAVFRATNRLGSATWTVTGHVVRAAPPEELAWTVLDPSFPSSTWSYALRAAGSGTHVTQRFAHGPGPSGVRGRIGDDPAVAAVVVPARTQMLRSAMAATLARAAHSLGDPG